VVALAVPQPSSRCSSVAAGGWFGRGAWEGAGPARAVTREALDAHRLYIAEVRHPIEVKAGENHLNPWLSRRIGYPVASPNLDTLELKLLGGRLLPGNSGRAAALYMYETRDGRALHHSIAAAIRRRKARCAIARPARSVGLLGRG
jgi:anti-sigma factor RsiW